MHASDLEPLNIFERYAFTLACIERLCRAWEVMDEPFVAEMITAHWGLLSHRLLAGRLPDGKRFNWWSDTIRFFPKPCELETRVRHGSLSADQVHSLHHAINELRMVPSRDMYCQPESHRSAIYALNVVGILLQWGVAPPPPGEFRIEGYRPEEFGYGTRSYVRSDFFGDDGSA